ncbi:MAG: VCBS repeat-containing protein [Gammaproteobacteria bacterium]|nr:VCBS repeat-containing protein [Gammaproteobacteria bacterium]
MSNLGIFLFAFSIVFCTAACDAKPATEDVQRADFSVTTLQADDGENSVCIGDFDDDGRLDIVIAVEDHHRLSLLRGDGDGGFSASVTVAAGESPTSVAHGYLDQDAHLDLIVANHETDYLTFLRGDGAGGFSPAPGSSIGVDVAPHPHVVRVADLNGDGNADLIVDSRDKAGVYALASDGDGGFASPGTAIEVGGAPYLGFALGDINGDGVPDLVTPNRDTVSVLINESKTGIAFRRLQRLRFASPFAVELADLDGDGRLDLIVASEADDDNIGIFLGNAGGGFPAEADTTLTVEGGPKTLAVGDFDGDRRSDVVVTAWRSDIRIISAAATGFMTTALPQAPLEAPWNTSTGDLNNDGRADIVVTDGDGAAVNVYLSAGPTVSTD